MIDQECRRGLFVETYTVTLLAVRCPHHDEWRVMRGEYREYLARVFGPKQRDGIHAPFQQGAQDHGLLFAFVLGGRKQQRIALSGECSAERLDPGRARRASETRHDRSNGHRTQAEISSAAWREEMGKDRE